MSRGTRSLSARLAALVLAAVAMLCVGFPGVAVAWRVMAAEVDPGGFRVSWGLLASTLGWCAGIGVLATLLSVPGAWWLAKRGWRAAGVVCLPLLMPTYLAYAGIGLLRAPRSFLGDLIERTAQDGATWLPSFAGRVAAVLGLSLWVWPVAAVVLAMGIRGLARDAVDSLQMDCRSRLSRGLHLARMLRGSVGTSVVAVGLVMLGSAVPLHLAGAPTYSVRVWYEMTLAPGSPGAWASAWPLLAMAGIGAWWVIRRGMRPFPTASGSVGGRGGIGTILAMGVLVMSVALPWGLLAGHLESVRALANFWKLHGQSLMTSLGLALGVALVCGVVAIASWMCASSFDARSRLAAKMALGVFVLGAFIPGVLVGQATAQAWGGGWSAGFLDSPGVLVLAHVARFGAIAGGAGWVVGLSEPLGSREARRLDGVTGLWGFAGAVMPGRTGVVLAFAVACGCLSLHEIEAAVLLQPPGMESLPRTLLGYLHYSRLGDLSAAVVWLAALGGVLALGVWMVAGGKGGGVQPGRGMGSTMTPENPS